MQAVQVVVYPIQFIFMKCRACINWLLSAWRGMFTRRRPINMRYVYVNPREAQRPMPKSQRTRLNSNRPVPTNTEDLPSGIPLKRPVSAQKAVRKNYYRPAVIPLKWYEVATNANKPMRLSDNLLKTEETSPKVTEQPLQVPQNETGSKSPKYEGRKKLQKPVNHRSANSSTMREGDNKKGGAKLASKETKRTPFVNKRWSY